MTLADLSRSHASATPNPAPIGDIDPEDRPQPDPGEVHPDEPGQGGDAPSEPPPEEPEPAQPEPGSPEPGEPRRPGGV